MLINHKSSHDWRTVLCRAYLSNLAGVLKLLNESTSEHATTSHMTHSINLFGKIKLATKAHKKIWSIGLQLLSRLDTFGYIVALQNNRCPGMQVVVYHGALAESTCRQPAINLHQSQLWVLKKSNNRYQDLVEDDE